MKHRILRTSGTILAAAIVLASTAIAAPTACNILYAIQPQNTSAFGATITIENTGTTAISSWSLTWAFANGQAVSSLWNGIETQSGANVTVTSESYNGSVAAGGSVTGVGFNGTWNGVTNAIPTAFSLSGTACSVNGVPPGGGPGSFTLKASASTLSLTAGASATDTVTVTDIGGFTGSVTLAASGLPTGVTAAFSANPTTATSVLTLTASCAAAATVGTITITGTSGKLTASTTIALTATAAVPGSYTLSPSASTLSVTQGSSVTDTITIAPAGCTAGNVTLAASGLPAGVTAAFGTNPATTTSVLTLTASSTATVGAATVTITGTSGTLQVTTTISLTVKSGGSFSLKPASSTLAIVPGSSATDAITITEVSPFTGSVTLAASGLPAGVTAAFGTDPATTTSVLTLTASSTATVACSAATIAITGTSGTLTATTAIALTISGPASFTLVTSAPTLTIAVGSSGTDTITPHEGCGFTGSLTLSASGLPAGVTAAFGTNPTSSSSVLTLTVASTATAGTSTVTITGTSGALTATTTVALTVTAAGSFTLKPSAAALSVAQGGSGADTITVTDVGSFTGSVTLAASGLPAGVTAAFATNPATAASVLTLTAAGTATAGTSNITITGTSGTLSETATIALTVTPVTAGNACAVAYVITPQNSVTFGGALTIDNTGTTAWTSWTLTWTFANGQTIASGWNGVFTQSGANLTVTNESYNGAIPAGGSYTQAGFDGNWNGAANAAPTAFSINGTACSVALTPSFTLKPSAAALSLLQGASATDTIAVTDIDGFTGAVTLAAANLPAGVTAAFAANPATGSSAMTLTASSSATAGPATVTITGTSGTLQASTAVALTVSTAGSFTLASSPSNLEIYPGAAGAPATITVKDVSPFSGNVTFAVTGLPSGVTATWSTISTTSSAVVTLTASSTAAAGPATVTITGTSGTATASTTIALTVSSKPLAIAWVSPSSGIAGSSMTIIPAGVGTSFGAAQGTSAVYFGTTAAAVTTWTVNSIAVTVPSLAAGTYNVTVEIGGVTSTSAPFTVTAAAPSPEQYTGNSTWFSALGTPYGGCGVPEGNLDSLNFVALNVQNDPGNYLLTLARPISATGPYAGDIGMWDNGLNCGRWVHVTMGNNCGGVNDGSQSLPFCRGGDGWVADQFNGADLDLVVADSCQDENSWCRDDPYHLDQAQAALNQYVLDGAPVGDLYPGSWNNRQIHWYFEPAPNYTGDINIAFLEGASDTWSAISITHLPNGIGGVRYLLNGVWTAATMDADLGDDYVVLPTVAEGTSYAIQVLDATGTLIQGGRIYSFTFPASCGTSQAGCSAAFTPIAYTASQ